MIIIDAQKREVEISQRHWSLAEDLFLKWGHTIPPNAIKIKVVDVDDLTPELSAWGIPWKWRG